MTKTIMKTYNLKREVATSHKYNLANNGFITTPGDAAHIIKEVMQTEYLTKEHFFLASLNTKNKIEALHIVHVGTINSAVVHPREIFQLALLDNAATIIVAHNHPSLDSSPSQEDIHVTRRLVEAGKMIGIKVLDHVILGDDFTSLKEKGYL